MSFADRRNFLSLPHQLFSMGRARAFAGFSCYPVRCHQSHPASQTPLGNFQDFYRLPDYRQQLPRCFIPPPRMNNGGGIGPPCTRQRSERGRKIFFCPQCRYVTDRKNNLKRHIVTMHQECPKTLECCGILFRSKASLREHVTLFHSAGYRCRMCGRNFCRKALLRRHLSVHSGKKDFVCSFCSYATSHKSNLERHQKVHNKPPQLSDSARQLSGSFREKDVDRKSLRCQPLAVAKTTLNAVSRSKKLFLSDRLRQTYPKTGTPVEIHNLETIGAQRSSALENSKYVASVAVSYEMKSKLLKVNPARIFMTPYKCMNCGKLYSHQSHLNSHKCRCQFGELLSIIRPLATQGQKERSVTRAISWTEGDNERAARSCGIAEVLSLDMADPSAGRSGQMSRGCSQSTAGEESDSLQVYRLDDLKLPLKKRIVKHDNQE